MLPAPFMSRQLYKRGCFNRVWVYYCCGMADPTRFSVAKHLAQLGLRKTLIAVKSTDGYAVSRIKKMESTVEFTRLGLFSGERVPVIGRVGIPDPQLGVSWKDTLTFYGKWFDELGETDAGYHLRKSISSLSHKRLLEQIERDDQYALVGGIMRFSGPSWKLSDASRWY